MSKIAIIDLFFYWPPGGGSHVDIKEMAERLSADHEVTVLLPNIKKGAPFKCLNIDFLLNRTKFYNRGIVRQPLNLKFEIVEFDWHKFNYMSAPKIFLDSIKKINPDSILFAQGSFMKPYIINALKDFRIVSRYYSNECFCLKGDGQLFRKGKICDVNYLDNKLSSYLKCLLCSSCFLIGYPSPLFLHEYTGSMAFMPSHRNEVIKSFKNTDTILVYNDFIKNRLTPFCKNTLIVPGGVNLAPFTVKASTNRNDKLKILILGRSDDKTKGFDQVFNVCKKLWQKRMDFSLAVTVRDNLPERFRADFVENLGWIPFDEIPKIYASSDIVIVPSRWAEPFGIVAVEAMAAHKPVIASRVGGLQKIVVDGETGFLFDSDNLVDLEEKLIKLMDDKNLRNQMGLKGRKRVETEYTWDIVYAKYYKEVFNRS